MDDRNRQLFILPKETINSLTLEEVSYTAKQMREVDIFIAPMGKFDIKLQGDLFNVVRWIHSEKDDTFLDEEEYKEECKDKYVINEICYRYDTYDNQKLKFIFQSGLKFETDKEFHFYPPQEHYNLKKKDFKKHLNRDVSFDEFYSIEYQTAYRVLMLLIVVLATKNIKKNTIEFKQPNQNSRKKPKKYKYVTTINIGQITETYKSDGSLGGTVRPHLRRGHIRNQHYGEGNKEIKKIFIQPVFVNADDGWINNQRKAYVVKT